MSLITWTKEQFGTDIPLHDQEHQTIFRMLNALHASVVAGDRKTVGLHLDDLIGFVAEHFGSEERNMVKCGYADYEQHKQEHDHLVATCVDLQRQFHAGLVEITQETTAFVKSWLVSHIPNIDRRYAPAFTTAGLA